MLVNACTFVWVGCVRRDRLLPRWIKIISKTRVTASMYEDQSFLRDPALLQFVIQVLESLKDFEIVLEASLIRGVNLWASHAAALGFRWCCISIRLLARISRCSRVSSLLHSDVTLMWYYCTWRQTMDNCWHPLGMWRSQPISTSVGCRFYVQNPSDSDAEADLLHDQNYQLF